MQISSSKSINQNMHENGVGLTQLPLRSQHNCVFFKTFFHCQRYLSQHSFHPHPHSQVCKLMNLSVLPHFSDDSWIQGGAAIEASNGLSGNLSNTFNPSLILTTTLSKMPANLSNGALQYHSISTPNNSLPCQQWRQPTYWKTWLPLHSAPSTSHKLHIPHNPIFTLSTSPISLSLASTDASLSTDIQPGCLNHHH